MLSAFQARAQEPYAQHFSISNGLPSNSVYSLLEDKQGFIWFTCDEGLFRYDGVQYKSYRSKQQTNFVGSSLFLDAKGRIWYENFDGNAFYVQNDELIAFTQQTKSNFYPLKATDKVLFIQEKGKVNAVDLRTFKTIKSFKINEFAYSCETINNVFYYIDNQKLYTIDQELKQRKIADLPFPKKEFTMLTSHEDQLYFTQKNSTENKIWKLKGNKLIPLVSINTNHIIQHLRVIGNRLFLLSSHGVCSYNLSNLNQSERYFTNKNITDVLRDRKGNLWFSSSMDGLYIVPNQNVKLFQFDDIFPYRSINLNNQLIISSKNEKVILFNTENYHFETISSGLSNALPYYLFVDHAKNELVRVQSDGFTYFTEINSKKLKLKTTRAIKHIATLDHKYKAFASTGVNGFYCYKSDLNLFSNYDQWISSLEKQDEGEVVFYRIPIDYRGKFVFIDHAKNEIYFLTNIGTYCWSNGVIKKARFNENVQVLNKMFYWNNRLLGLDVDGKIVDWNAKKHPTFNNALNDLQQVKQIINDNNNLYVRTSSKLNIYRIKKNGNTELTNSLDLTDLECNDFSIIGNTVWIMASNSIIRWQSANRRTIIEPGKFIITRIQVNDSEYPTINGQKLSHDENQITIDFVLLDFGVRTISNLEYKINNKEWASINPMNRSLSFPALAPGDYNIQIRGLVNRKIVPFESLQFTIRPPFYITTWFLLAVFILVVIVIVFYYRNKLKTNRLRNRLANEKIVLESNLNKSLLASIKSQMNPHFIFNALNTIQAYIYMNDKENASGYLSKFSKLMRSVLEMSEKEEILLSEDLNALVLYLDLEKMRFQEGFNYSIQTIDFEADSVKIPSMLLQPYVENAIKHGLLHSENDKTVRIEIRKENRTLTVSIDDNGIGRKRSEELNQLKGMYHEGFSTKANEKRLSLLNTNTEISVIYIDKYDENQQALGTTVQLKIKLN